MQYIDAVNELQRLHLEPTCGKLNTDSFHKSSLAHKREGKTMSITEIVLSDDEMKALQALADARKASISEIVKEAIKPLLHPQRKTITQEQKANAKAVAGKFRSGVNDLASNHNKYFAEAIEGKS